MEINWHDGFSIRVREDGNAVIISANKAGLLSLSDQLRTLAEGETGDHIQHVIDTRRWPMPTKIAIASVLGTAKS